MPSASTNSFASPALTTAAPVATDLSAPPCFFWAWCGQRSAIEKAGRSVCRKCATFLRGVEYPLRFTETEPLVTTSISAESRDAESEEIDDAPHSEDLESAVEDPQLVEL